MLWVGRKLTEPKGQLERSLVLFIADTELHQNQNTDVVVEYESYLRWRCWKLETYRLVSDPSHLCSERVQFLPISSRQACCQEGCCQNLSSAGLWFPPRPFPLSPSRVPALAPTWSLHFRLLCTTAELGCGNLPAFTARPHPVVIALSIWEFLEKKI